LVSCLPDAFDKIKILPASVNSDFLTNSLEKIPKKSIHFLFCGRFIELKNPLFVLEIFKKIYELDYSVKLTMIGEGELLSSCKEYVKKNGLVDLVDFPGYLPHEEIIPYYLCSDIFLFPGKKGEFGFAETQGLVLQEAQAMRLPILISDVGGMRHGM